MMEKQCQPLIVQNGDLFTSHRFLHDGAVLIRGDKIIGVGARKEFAHIKNAKVLDAHGGLIMPGLIDLHTHLYSSFARGISVPGSPAKDFNEILNKLWWRLDRELMDEDVFYSALVGLIDAVKCGTTSILDHHSSPNAIAGSLWCIAAALEVVPVRAALSYEVSDRDGRKARDMGIEENVLFARSHGSDPMIRSMFGLHASFTLSDQSLSLCVREADKVGLGFHVHTAEAQSDVKATRKKYGQGVVERWRRMNILGPKSLLAHCVHVSDREMNIIERSCTNVANNPSSNMNNAVGLADVPAMLRRGCSVGLGTDGMSHDMFLESKFANLSCRNANRDPRLGFSEAGDLLLKNNPKICRKLFGWRIGSIEPGSFADVITLDYKNPTPLGAKNFLGHFLYGMSSSCVRSSVINGRVVMHDRHLVGLNENMIYSEARRVAAKFWKRFQKGGKL